MPSGLKRIAKGTPSKAILEEVKHSLDIEHLKPYCYLPYVRSEVDVSRCCSKCTVPCNHFLGFHFVMDACVSLDCSYTLPCEDCLEAIEAIKLYKKTVHALKDFDITRFNKYVKACRKGKEK